MAKCIQSLNGLRCTLCYVRYPETEGHGAGPDPGGEDGAAAATVGGGGRRDHAGAAHLLPADGGGDGHESDVQGGPVGRPCECHLFLYRYLHTCCSKSVVSASSAVFTNLGVCVCEYVVGDKVD